MILNYNASTVPIVQLALSGEGLTEQNLFDHAVTSVRTPLVTVAGGEQNAPLGRAVIGGLVFATVATLMFVPVVFSLVHGKRAPSDATPLETAPHAA